jgi:hypothetical protein
LRAALAQGHRSRRKNVQVIALVWNGKAVIGSSAHKNGSYLILNRLPGGAYDISTRSEP